MNKKYRLDDLQYKGLKIYQDEDLYAFTSDSVLLSNFFKCKKTDVLVDFCSGSGIVAILGSAKNNFPLTHTFEIQKDLFEMQVESVRYNKLENIISHNACISSAKEIFGNNKVDVVVCNPPYRKLDSHVVGEDEAKNICRYEVKLDLEMLIRSASEILKDKGKFYFVHDASRLDEIILVLEKYKFKAKEIQFVYGTFKKNSNVCLIKAIKNGGRGMIVLPPKLNVVE